MKIERFEIRDNLRTTNGWLMRNDQILSLFGLPPNGHIPPNYSAERTIGNVRVRIVPQGALKIKRRVVAHCPECDKVVCAGHLDQHMRKHKKDK
jgi:hypothetical protein